MISLKSMTVLQQQIIACAKENGYTESKYIQHNVVRHVNGNINDNNQFDNGEWWIRTGMREPWIVTDDQLKQWQRDKKLKEIGI